MDTQHNLRVLFVSSMSVSPVTGGGNTTFNLLEPGPPRGEVFYAAPTMHPPQWVPFPEIAPRTCRFYNVSRPLPVLPRVRFIKGIGRLNNLIDRIDDWAQKETVVRDVARCIKRLDIDVLLVCPQNAWVDVAAAPEFVERTGLPSVAWFMDDYFADERARSLVGEIWSNAHRRFVISESMQERYSDLYGGECEVLNNSVTFPDRFSEPADRQGTRLRVVYAGAMNAYYAGSISKVLRELAGLGEEVELDIYSPDELPPEWRTRTDVPWRHLRPIPAGELIERLQQYDLLLLLSSFEPEWRMVAETAQAGKMADYLAAGRCVLAFGPPYAENVRYLERYGIGEAVTSQAPGALREAILSLAQDSDRRRELGERAYRFGREHRDKARNSTRLWQALSEAAASSPIQRKRQTTVGAWSRNIAFRFLYTLGMLKRGIRWIVKGRSNATSKG
jgi:glycosyltransferase involved in cell wall biosynthesis